jgi:hypothetical protein
MTETDWRNRAVRTAAAIVLWADDKHHAEQNKKK